MYKRCVLVNNEYKIEVSCSLFVFVQLLYINRLSDAFERFPIITQEFSGSSSQCWEGSQNEMRLYFEYISYNLKLHHNNAIQDFAIMKCVKEGDSAKFVTGEVKECDNRGQGEFVSFLLLLISRKAKFSDFRKRFQEVHS